MVIYRIIAKFGLDSEIDNRIATTGKKATELALKWLENKDCDSVDISEEYPDNETQLFKTYRLHKIERPF